MPLSSYETLTSHINARILNSLIFQVTDEETNETSIKHYAVTQLETTHARKVFPCFDEPDKKATFSIAIGHHLKYNALSNMPVKARIKSSPFENFMWTVFKTTTIVMSTYIVAFAVSDFECIHSEEDGIIFRVWAKQGASGPGLMCRSL